MNSEELKAAREDLKKTQLEMAKYLGVSYSTYVKWETDKTRKKPIVHKSLEKLKMPPELDLSTLSIREIDELDQLARSKGMPLVQLAGEFIRQGLKASRTILPLIALIVVGYQAFHPKSEDQFARRFGRRREGGVEGVEIMGEA